MASRLKAYSLPDNAVARLLGLFLAVSALR